MTEEETTEVAAAEVIGCANCGVPEIDEVKLKKCGGGCDLVEYCSDKCQQDHRQTHAAICKERAAELRDEILFRQSESSHLGDCPICFLPMPFDKDKSTMHSCCSKMICDGCVYANKIREIEQRLIHRCPFCRKLLPTTDKEIKANDMERVAANDPLELCEMGKRHQYEGDFEGAFTYFIRAAKLSNADAHYNLSLLYREGLGVEKDEEKCMFHMEEAAIAGCPEARCHLGCWEWSNERFDRAVKHWIIAANLGHDLSLEALKEGYKDGQVSKDDLAVALRAHQAALDAMKSPQREAAAKWYAERFS